MQLYRLTRNFNLADPLVLTIGNFDGVHKGHQDLLGQIKQYSINFSQKNLTKTAVLSFFPHPKKIINRQSPALLTSLHDRAFWLDYYQLDYWLLLTFTNKIRNLNPEDFIANIKKSLNIKMLIVGDDFRFGYQGKGDFDWLKKRQKQLGFLVKEIDSVNHDSQRISSSQIRLALNQKNLIKARDLLGHDLTFTGKVRRGAGRGKKLNAPTINIFLPDFWACPDGVYVVKAIDLNQQKTYFGVANVGGAPTFSVKKRQLEMHIFDQNQDFYGKTLRIYILHFLRDNQKFADIDQLKQQISSDIQSARYFLKI